MNEPTYQNAIFFEGEDEARKRVRTWLEKYANSAENEGDLQIEVYHHVAGDEDPSPFDVIEFEYGAPPEALARKIVESATDYCDGVESGKARFRCEIDGVRGTCVFTITVPERGTGDEVDEAPNMKGLLMQDMRHKEALINANTKMVAQVSSMYERVASSWERMAEAHAKRVQELEKGQVETIRAFEDINSARHIRDLELKKLEKSERRMDQVAGILMQGAPALFNKFLGGPAGERNKIVAEGWTPLETQLMGFVATFNNEQLEKVAQSGIFTPDQLMGFMELARTLIEKKEAEDKAHAEKRAREEGSTNGASHQNGAQSAPQQ